VSDVREKENISQIFFGFFSVPEDLLAIREVAPKAHFSLLAIHLFPSSTCRGEKSVFHFPFSFLGKVVRLFADFEAEFLPLVFSIMQFLFGDFDEAKESLEKKKKRGESEGTSKIILKRKRAFFSFHLTFASFCRLS